jgi:single-strand DNA-binding protein
MSINKVLLVGNVGKDPVVRYFEKGVAKATFPLATSETYTNQQGETITSTEWHNIVLWRALAEVAEKTVRKGSQVYIIGKIKTRSYVDKDGNNKYITEILADMLMVLEKKQGQTGYPSQTDGSKEISRDKGAHASEISEPDSSYHVPGENITGSSAGKGNANDYETGGPGGTFSNGPGAATPEDDLPF